MNATAAFKAVEWTPVDEPAVGGPDPYATHSGVMKLGEQQIRVYRLSNGHAVVHQDDILKLLGAAA